MNLLWIGLFLLSSTWLFTLPIFADASGYWIPCLIGGILFNTFAFWRAKASTPSVKHYLLGIPLLLFIFLLPFPHNLGSLLILASLALSPLRRYFRRITSLLLGLFFSGVILFFQNLAISLYYILGSRYHRVDVLAPLVCRGLKLIGVNAYLNQGIIYVPRVVDIFYFITTWQRLGLLLVILTLIGGFVLLFLSKSWRRSLLILASLLVVFPLVRHIFLILVVLSTNRLNCYWSPLVTMVTFLPLFLLLARWIPAAKTNLTLTLGEVTPLKYVSVFGLAFLSTFFFLFAFGFQDPGEKKAGRVLIDEFHSDWEWTEQEFDTKWYGRKSGYNYYCLAEFLGYYYKISRGHEKLTKELLSNYDVLIIKTPTEALLQEEIAAIRDFVRAGGGLYLIGDHTNVFGSSGYLNQLARLFGFHFRFDSTYDLATSALSVYRRPGVLPHPIVAHMPPFLFATSCTIGASLLAQGVIVGNKLRTLPLDYSQRSFFPAKGQSYKDYDFGLFLQAVARKYGRGRVVGFTDSTVFSNFFMFIPGKPELALGTIEWLNRRNKYSFLNWIFFILFALCGYLSIRAGSKVAKETLAFFLLGGIMMASPIALRVVSFLNYDKFYPIPTPHTKYTRIAFEQEHSDFFIPSLRLGSNQDNNFHTFFVWTQRLGFVPKAYSKLDGAIREGDAVVVIEPQKPFSIQDVDLVSEYVERGGRVLVLDDPTNRRSTANQLLTLFGLEIGLLPPRTLPIYDDSLRVVATARNPGRVTGGTPVLRLRNGGAVLVEKEWGKGKIMVFANSSLFNTRSMGHTGVTPTPEQIKINEMEFFIFRRLMGLNQGKPPIKSFGGKLQLPYLIPSHRGR